MENKPAKSWEPIDFTIYFSLIKWVVFFSLILEVVFRTWSMNWEDGILAQRREEIIWGWRVLVFIFLGWRTKRRFGPSEAVGAMTGVIAGVIMGLVIALYRFIDGFKIWKIFNIITEATITALMATIILVAVIFLLNLKSKNK